MRRVSLSRRGGRLVQEAGASHMQWGAFAPGVPEVRMFPAQVWKLAGAAVALRNPHQLNYATRPGRPRPARRGNRLPPGHARRGLHARAGGHHQRTQQSLQLVAQLLAVPGDTVWLEDPGYWGARSVFRAMWLNLERVAVDGEGMAPLAEQLRRPPRAMFISPSHQYPLGR